MIQVLIALGLSLAQSVGGDKAALVMQILNTVSTVLAGNAEAEAFLTPWVVWANSINDADRDPTTEEHAAGRALADAVHANNVSLAAGGAPLPLPSPPTA